MSDSQDVVIIDEDDMNTQDSDIRLSRFDDSRVLLTGGAVIVAMGDMYV